MKTGTVMGPLETAKSAPGYEAARWAQIRTETGIVVALDPIGVRPGDTVVFAQGAAAERYDMGIQTDAVITAVAKKK